MPSKGHVRLMISFSDCLLNGLLHDFRICFLRRSVEYFIPVLPDFFENPHDALGGFSAPSFWCVVSLHLPRSVMCCDEVPSLFAQVSSQEHSPTDFHLRLECLLVLAVLCFRTSLPFDFLLFRLLIKQGLPLMDAVQDCLLDDVRCVKSVPCCLQACYCSPSDVLCVLITTGKNMRCCFHAAFTHRTFA